MNVQMLEQVKPGVCMYIIHILQRIYDRVKFLK